MRVSVSPLQAPADRGPLGPVRQVRVAPSRGGEPYLVTLYGDGSLTCTCKGFEYSARADGLCRHVDLVRGQLTCPLDITFLLAREP